MHRDLRQLADRDFDLIVIGGGITGAFTAWDATLRGLSVALLERGDFGHATSAASSKVVHGGIRYMQQGAVGRVRESLVERMIFRRIAPHLVHPLPFLIPTYGHGMRGKEVLSLGMLAYELIGFDQNRLADPGKHLPRFEVLSRRRTLELEPDLPAAGLTGGVRYYECHMHSSERMTLAVVQAAAAAGARVANHAEVSSFELADGRVTGVTARDTLAGDTFALRGRVIANATGPWARRVLDRGFGKPSRVNVGLAKGVHMLTRPLTRSGAVAIATHQRNEALVSRGGRHLFIIPWRDRSLIGTTNVPYAGDPAAVGVTATDVADFVDDVNSAFPAARLDAARDVCHAFAGLYPLVDKDIDPTVYQGMSQYQVYDHRERDGVAGLVTVIGAKYTTARNLARKTVDLVFRQLERPSPRPRTDRAPVAGGDIARYDDFLRQALAGAGRPGAVVDDDVLRDMVPSYGSELPRVLALAGDNAEWAARLTPERPVIAAEVVYAVREEMACRLADVVFRRTGLGTIGHPGRRCLEACARIMAIELGWSEVRMREEVEEVDAMFPIRPRGEMADAVIEAPSAAEANGPGAGPATT